MCLVVCSPVSVLVCTLWLLLANVVASVQLHLDSDDNFCSEKCTCGTFHSADLQQHLVTLNCSFAKLEILPDNIPDNLQVLILRGNAFSGIPESISKLKKLLQLDLSGNGIKSFGNEATFKNISQMIHLNIGKNYISTIFRQSLSGLESLEHLILSFNNINYIEDEALIELKNLRNLDIGQNLLGSLYGEWFHGLRKLTSLDLSHNRIHNIPSSAFSSLVSLEHLYLVGNRISLVDPRAFSGLLNLKLLNLKGNLLSGTPTAALQSLPLLETLTLDQNPIIKIKPLDFSHLSVSTISLCEMPELIIIDAKSFYNLNNISSIKLYSNKRLSFIDPLAFMNVVHLKELKLHNNNLIGLQKEMEKYLPKGVHLNIYNNPLQCDCNARWLQNSIVQGSTAKMVIIKPERLKCHTPPRYFAKLLKDLDTSKLPKLCPPVVLNLTQTGTIVGKAGERQVFECRALGSPIPQLHWILPDGSRVNSTLNEVRRRFFHPGTFVYYHTEPRDSGLYTCLAQNSEGSANFTVRLSITCTDFHLFPKHVTPNAVALTWNGTESHAFPSYKLIYNEIDENGTDITESIRFHTVDSLQSTHTIGHLRPSTNYNICIGHEDLSGYWMQFACCQVLTAGENFPSENFQQVSALRAIGYITIMAAMVVLLICLIIILMRIYKHRLYESPNKITNHSNKPTDNIYQPILAGS